MLKSLTFSDYQAVLRKFNYTPGWDLPRWTNATAGEIGESLIALGRILCVCNTAKKIDRGNESEPSREELLEQLGDELADIIGYTCHTANQEGIDLEAAIRRKYGKVCEKLKRFDYPLP